MPDKPTKGRPEVSTRTPWWIAAFPPAGWLPAYRREWLGSDVIAGITLAAYEIPVSLAYASLAGLPPHHAPVRDILRAEGLEERVGPIDRRTTVDDLIEKWQQA